MPQSANAHLGQIAVNAATSLERTQMSRYHTRNGHGFAAEDANFRSDWLRGRSVRQTGGTHALNGPDRIVNGVPVQTKYCNTARQTVAAAFDPATRRFRYGGQRLEVPADQYDEAVALMRLRISVGQVPGVSDPSSAESIVTKGSVTYGQARNVARFGTVESLKFDLETGVISSAAPAGIAFVIEAAVATWHGLPPKQAAVDATKKALLVAATSTATTVATAQLIRTPCAAATVPMSRMLVRGAAGTTAGREAIAAVARNSLGRGIYGAAAVNHVAKLARTNVVSAAVSTVVATSPDLYRAAWARNASWTQFFKNLFSNASGAVGGAGGFWGGVIAGTTVAGPIGGAVGGLVGSMTAGFAGSAGGKWVADQVARDDADQVRERLQAIVAEIALEYLLTESEFDELLNRLSTIVDDDWLRSMYRAGLDAGEEYGGSAFAWNAVEPHCEEIVANRPLVLR